MSRPCRYCVAQMAPFPAESSECELEHRDEPRVYDLAFALAQVFQGTRTPTEQQVAWFLADANEVVDDFTPPPDPPWRVRRLRAGVNDGERGIEVRVQINGVSYVALEGGKDSRGSLLSLAEFREIERGDER